MNSKSIILEFYFTSEIAYMICPLELKLVKLLETRFDCCGEQTAFCPFYFSNLFAVVCKEIINILCHSFAFVTEAMTTKSIFDPDLLSRTLAPASARFLLTITKIYYCKCIF